MADPRYKRPTRQVNFRWNVALKEILAAAAAERDQSFTDFVRDGALLHAGRADLVPARARATQTVLAVSSGPRQAKQAANQVSFRWDPDVKDLLVTAAAERDETLTDFVRDGALLHAGRADLVPTKARQEVMHFKITA
ncbi:MAG: hypothetical protein WAW85_07690 [Gordonia sp. (in: high G+C Gram-positive bacteria)]|uniref:hypothetical protein n=1 Tax=Gordonia sp. (in: high G+C Gram-positive bacteria) TaxID=84139 RepID=UPI003BB6F7FC